MATLTGQSHHQHWGYSSHNFLQLFGTFLLSIGKRMKRYSQLTEQRRRLLELDDYQLKDIGISRAEAVQAARGH
ncbi:MAG: DUF1127 domain-containing protein [Desulfuromusa sp.]|nr:DUF1127 domain-containing protein [Desulfuromusa sp.]